MGAGLRWHVPVRSRSQTQYPLGCMGRLRGSGEAPRLSPGSVCQPSPTEAGSNLKVKLETPNRTGDPSRLYEMIVLQLSKYFYWLLVACSLSIGIIIVYWTHWSTPELVIWWSKTHFLVIFDLFEQL
jgi:hypothetical protein